MKKADIKQKKFMSEGREYGKKRKFRTKRKLIK